MTKNSIDRPTPEIADRVLFEDNHLIIINKAASELVQGDITNDATLGDKVKEFIKERDAKAGNVFLGIPHRLDRPVSGVVIYTKTSKALSRMAEIFRLKEIKKTYWAIVEKKPEKSEGTLRNYLHKIEKQNKSYVSDVEKPQHKEAVLHYKLLLSSDRYHLIAVELETGRHHQIRAQLAHIGCIIKGDLKYGAKRSNPDASISLHSRVAEFKHPVKEDAVVRVVAPCPNDGLWQWFEQQIQD